MSEEVSREFHFTTLVDTVIDDERLGKNELLVYLTLCRFAGKDRTAFPGIRTLATKSRLSPNTAQVGLKNLEKFGYLIIENRTRTKSRAKTSNLYRITDAMAYQPVTHGVSATDTGGVSTTNTEVDPLSQVNTQKVEEAPLPPSFSKEFEEILAAHIPGYKHTPQGSKTIDDMVGRIGEEAAKRVGSKLYSEKMARKDGRKRLLRFGEHDLIERLRLEVAELDAEHQPELEALLPACPSCGRSVKRWELTESSECVHCQKTVAAAEIGAYFDEISKRLGQRKAV